jgi:hypothetical protein
MSDLWAVALGGAIGLAGSLTGGLAVEWRRGIHAKQEQREERQAQKQYEVIEALQEKLLELMGLAMHIHLAESRLANPVEEGTIIYDGLPRDRHELLGLLRELKVKREFADYETAILRERLASAELRTDVGEQQARIKRIANWDENTRKAVLSTPPSERPPEDVMPYDKMLAGFHRINEVLGTILREYETRLNWTAKP